MSSTKGVSVADPGCFIPDPGSGSEHFSIPDPDPNIFLSRIRIRTFYIPDPRLFIKRVLIVKKIFIPDPEKIYPGSSSRIQWVKKHRIPDPDPQH
jgi:hypothetical protein